MNTADLLIEHLYRHGVRDLFGMPGSHSTHLYDAIQRHGKIRTILIRNEQAGAYAADGYARVTGRPGVICTTAGPGATNALSGVAEAYADSTPVLLLTGQVNASRLHQECGAYHELDLEGVFRPCTAYVGTVMESAQVPAMLERAFAAMTRNRPRPAALILPQDVMAAPTGMPSTSGTSEERETVLPPDEVRRACELLLAAKRPLILAGGGAVWSDASREVLKLAEKLNCPVVSTLNGKGIIDERSPFALGHARGVKAMSALPHADAMLAVGCRFTEVLTRFHTMPVPKQLVQIDIDPGQVGMNYPVSVALPFDACLALQSMLDRLPESHSNEWSDYWKQARETQHPRPEWFIETLREELPEDAIVFTDASEMALRMQADFPAYSPRTFFYPSNYIALGWGFPAAVGGAVAAADRWVVSVSGDGGFTMSLQELATAVRYNLKVIAVVHNDSAYGAIKNLQRIKHEARYLDTELNNPDFMLLARSFGLPGSRATNAPEFASALRGAMKREGPSLIEVPDEWRYLRI
jgi:acetolactate synthase I/II/III large subunit